MGELRKDYILDRWVVYSVGRGSRPHEFKESHVIVPEKTCFFCPGNEQLTPAEIGRIGTKDKWRLRWFANKFPALEPAGNSEPRTDNRFYTFASNYGNHEIIAETPEHNRQLSEFSVKEIAEVLEAYKIRIAELGKKPNIKYVNVIKNHGYHAGTSLVHSHSQVFATAFVPPAVREKVSAVRRFVSCPYCAIVEAERKSERMCFENSDWVAFCPYASRYNYEVWIFPKKHIRGLGEVGDVMPLAEIMQKVLSKIGVANVSYNYFVTYSPAGEDLHFHIEVMPQIAIYGGFERGSGAIINSVLPESAAEFYRGK
jgi:UDPglucose--hexose-1-phosphate uridylyltransferase